jgi:hypothetical protein
MANTTVWRNNMPKIVLVETISTFRHVYAVRLPDDEPNENAIDDVVWNADLIDSSLSEVSQNHIGEDIFSHRVVTEDQYIELFDRENDYLKEWPREKKLEFIFDSATQAPNIIHGHEEVDFGKPVGKEIW